MTKYPGSPERLMELLGDMKIALTERQPAVDQIAQLERLHAELYEEIMQTPYGKLSPSEPLFCVRGQDALFTRTVLAYAELYAADGGHQDVYRDLVQLAHAAIGWQTMNPDRLKLAD